MHYITPEGFKSVPCPTYPEIRLSLFPGRRLSEMIEQFRPCVVHISTEGPLGIAARNYCAKRDIPFTTAFHTKFPEYVKARTGIPISWSYAWLRWFHGPSKALMVSTKTMEDDLVGWGFENIARWSRGVDTDLFRPMDRSFLDHLPRPIHTYVGRVAVEKNLKAFLDIPLDGTKLIVGDGPQMAQLKRDYPEAVFVGAKSGDDLVQHFAASDVFVFPSKTDTFGLVLLEALACGVPVAAYPVQGPIDIVTRPELGALDEDLAVAIKNALGKDPKACRDHALNHSWDASAEEFVANLHPFDPDRLMRETENASSEAPAQA